MNEIGDSYPLPQAPILPALKVLSSGFRHRFFFLPWPGLVKQEGTEKEDSCARECPQLFLNEQSRPGNLEDLGSQ